MQTVLEVKNLTKVFKKNGSEDLAAVDHISFSLESSEVLGIVGESGSGKSTVAKLLTRLIDASDGQIILNGKDITNIKGRELREIYNHIQMVFQTPVGSFDPRKTLGYGIGESLQNKGVPKTEVSKRVNELLIECGLDESFVSRYPYEVSGGQAQRAAIARALANEPQILILDEATSALDVTIQKQVIELLQKLRLEKNLSYIFICHNLALVQMLCDKVVVMNDGKIVEYGNPDDVINNPQSDYTKQLVNACFV